jgi:membrane fusion protein (multidrug efflux system)
VQVTPQVAGTVIAIHADDTESVQAGKPLIELDRSDAELALHQAQAQLAQTVREVRTLYVNNNALAATVAARSADVARAKSDLARRQQLAGTGAVSGEDIAHAKTMLETAESALAAAREQLASNKVLTDRISIEKHPNVQRAASQLENAYLAWTRVVLPAPISGTIAKRSVQVGQRVAPGAPLLSIVALDSVWVDANFKEVQIANMRIGQPVTLQADVYGKAVTYHGRVAGLSAGTGSAFALLPTQNASGNWIKVVQRLPVRIELDPKELAEHPLQLGVSMRAKVDVTRKSGEPTAAAQARQQPAYQTKVFDAAGREAAAMISKIIAANLGGEAARSSR